ncbi:hypothetical protein ERJ75_001568000 [Trypanosoma vivax]|nr:hypothetical protein ERJ75_001568000 [Trypanosoma vivax]
MPTRNAQVTQKCRHRRRHRGSEQRGNGAQGRLGRPHRNDTKQHQHQQRHKHDAATTMEWKNDALAALGTIATRYAKVRQQAIDATKACEATKRCKEAQAQDRNDMVHESRHRAQQTQEHTEKREGTEKGENEAQTCANSGEVFDAQRGRCVVSAETHSGKTKAAPNAERESASAERMGTAWPRVAATMALAMTPKQAD